MRRHPEFRLFACMNPATDVGKKDLPAALRARFTEVFVDELVEPHDVREVVQAHVRGGIHVSVCVHVLVYVNMYVYM